MWYYRLICGFNVGIWVCTYWQFEELRCKSKLLTLLIYFFAGFYRFEEDYCDVSFGTRICEYKSHVAWILKAWNRRPINEQETWDDIPF